MFLFFQNCTETKFHFQELFKNYQRSLKKLEPSDQKDKQKFFQQKVRGRLDEIILSDRPHLFHPLSRKVCHILITEMVLLKYHFLL